MSRTRRSLAALARIALIVAGCSNAATGTGTGGGGGNTNAATHEQAMRFAECMRDNDVKDFPGPTEDGPLINVQGAPKRLLAYCPSTPRPACRVASMNKHRGTSKGAASENRDGRR